jgi:hypothetical protein
VALQSLEWAAVAGRESEHGRSRAVRSRMGLSGGRARDDLQSDLCGHVRHGP